MKKDKHTTKVKFLFEKDSDTEVFAFFPEEIHNGKVKTCYAHIGQHSACADEYAAECNPAKYADYQDLLKELIGLGYKLEVLNEQEIEYHRNPTPSEIRFGEGATHYRDFNINQCLKSNGKLKSRLKADDGLIYTR